uniref:Uncharacterized protein n=1 Tax=Lygus hesperus TaxID=30085 RepID=A0A0A9Z583_LYGHE
MYIATQGSRMAKLHDNSIHSATTFNANSKEGYVYNEQQIRDRNTVVADNGDVDCDSASDRTYLFSSPSTRLLLHHLSTESCQELDESNQKVLQGSELGRSG